MIIDADTQARFDLLDRIDDHTPVDERDDRSARKYAATLERGHENSLARKDGDAPTTPVPFATGASARRVVGSAVLDGGGGQTPARAGR